MDLFSNLSLPPLILLPILISVIIISFMLVFKRRKKTNLESSINPETATPQQAMPLNQELSQQNPANSPPLAPPPPQTASKPKEIKYLFYIIAAIIIALLIPVVIINLVKTQSLKTTSSNTPNLPSSPSCNAITITDTLGTPLSEAALNKLRPQDEVKILITGSGENIDKAHFRVNGSQWQEITIKQGNNFVGNYILDSGFKKFTIEAEIHDKNKGWL